MKHGSLWFLFATFFFLLTNMNTLYGQKLRKRIKRSDPITVIYTIDKKTKLKEGEFLKIYNRTQDTICIGKYERGNRISDWKFTYGDLNFNYNYESKDFLFLDTLFKANNLFYVKKDFAYKLTEVDRPAIFLDSELELRSFLAQNIELPDDIRNNYIEDYSVASITIDSIGNYRFLRIEKSISVSLDQEMIKTIQSLPNTFLPAMKDDKAVESKIYIVFNISHEIRKIKITPAPYRIVIDVIYYSVRLNGY